MLPTSDAERMTNEMFNRFAAFGGEVVVNDQVSLEDLIEGVFAHHELSREQFYVLFLQIVLLSTYFSQNFPFLEIFSIDDPVKGIVEGMLYSVCGPNSIQLATSKQVISTLLEYEEVAFHKLFLQVQVGNNVSETQKKEFIAACSAFKEQVRSHLQEAQGVFEHFEGEPILTKKVIIFCLSLFHTECEYGIRWVKAFWNYITLKYARIDLLYFKDIQRSGFTMQTLPDLKTEERYIKCGLFPCISVDEFVKVPIFIFHEYVSHLCASIYRGTPQNEQQKQEIIESYLSIRRKVDEGWMVHVAETFLGDKLSEILDTKRKHLHDQLKTSVSNWRFHMHNPFGGRAYAREAAEGGRIAAEFLNLLSKSISPNDEKQAKLLYYRFSFDLITRYPSSDFTHLHFIDTITSLHEEQLDYLVDAVQASLNKEKQYIDIEVLWDLIKDFGPKTNLPIPRKLL